MSGYYVQNLKALRLFQVYQTKHSRVRQYLDEEIGFVRRSLRGHEKVLEVGAGYGRIMRELAPSAASIVGIDISAETVEFGKDYLKDLTNCSLHVMNAYHLEFDGQFDVVLCLQNGLSAIKGQPIELIGQCMHALVPGGRAYFSTYSAKFWQHRLVWFHEQADKGLLGEIDPGKTQDGRIICRDGFVAITFSEDELRRLGKQSGHPYRIEEVDDSSLFLILEKQ